MVPFPGCERLRFCPFFFLSLTLQKCNKIHSGLRSGVVVLGNGKGSVRSNQIYNNKEAGVYILFSGNPVVRWVHVQRGLRSSSQAGLWDVPSD